MSPTNLVIKTFARTFYLINAQACLWQNFGFQNLFLNMRIDFNRRVETGRWYQLLLSFSKPAGVFYFSHKSYHSFSLHSSDIHATKLHTFLKSWTHLTSRIQNILHEKFSKNYMLHPTMASLLKYESLLEFQTGKLAVSWFRAFQMSLNIPNQVFIKIYYYSEKNQNKNILCLFTFMNM